MNPMPPVCRVCWNGGNPTNPNCPACGGTGNATVCTDEKTARLFWDNVNRLGELPCAEKTAALRHVALCPACAAKLKALDEAEVQAEEKR